MTALYKVFDLFLGVFSSVWNLLKGIYSIFMAIFDTFSSWFDDLFNSWGIYDAIADSLDAVTSIAQSINGLIDGGGFSSTVAGFTAIDTLFTVVSTAIAATFGVLLGLLSFVFVTTIPVLLGWLAFKAVMRLIRLCSAGVAKP